MSEEEKWVRFYQKEIAGVIKIEDKASFIKERIIPEMAERGRGGRLLTAEEIEERLTSLKKGKPGEEYEMMEALQTDELITSEMALEIADLVYYWLQPNCPDHLKTGADDFIELILGDWDLAFSFCLVKYKTRLAFGNLDDYKRIEQRVMTRYLEENVLTRPEFMD